VCEWIVTHEIFEGLGLIKQTLDVVRNQLSGIETNAHLFGRFLEASQSVIHVALASGPIIRPLEKSVCETCAKRVAAILDLLNQLSEFNFRQSE